MRTLLMLATLSSAAEARETMVELIHRLVEERYAEERVEASAAEALYVSARWHIEARQMRAALFTLAELARLCPRWAGAAHLIRAQIHEGRGDSRSAIADYRAALRARSIDTRASLMDAGNTDAVAHRALGELLEAEGDWLGAYRAWRAWKPHSWCGNEVDEQHAERRAGMARARRHLRR